MAPPTLRYASGWDAVACRTPPTPSRAPTTAAPQNGSRREHATNALRDAPPLERVEVRHVILAHSAGRPWPPGDPLEQTHSNPSKHLVLTVRTQGAACPRMGVSAWDVSGTPLRTARHHGGLPL